MYASAVCFTGNSLFAAGKLEQHGKAAQASPQRCEVAFAGRMSETALDVFSAAAAAASVAFCSCSCAERHPLSTLDAHQPSGCGGGPLIKWSHQKAAACAGRAAGPGVVGAQMLTRLLAAVHSPRWACAGLHAVTRPYHAGRVLSHAGREAASACMPMPWASAGSKSTLRSR